jgi:hypothetical protein
MLFADDSLIFIESSPRGAARLNVILNMYHEASGQLVNRDNSSRGSIWHPSCLQLFIFFSKKFEFKDSKKYERNTGTWRIICNTSILKVM